VREVFPPSQKRRLCRQRVFPSNLAPTDAQFVSLQLSSADPLTETSVVELRGYLANTLLRDVDTMSMAHSLEVRVPYVDHRVIEFALSLPGTLKLEGPSGKAVLRKALADLLPEGPVRRPKSYFSMPLMEWVAGPLLPLVRQALCSRVAADLFGAAGLLRLEREAFGGRGDRAWGAAVLATWMDRHGVRLRDQHEVGSYRRPGPDGSSYLVPYYSVSPQAGFY
jgi:asparagine synthetase B (glutamine-hydrolysing)